MERTATNFFAQIAHFNSGKATVALEQGKLEICQTHFGKMMAAIDNMVASIICDNLSPDDQARFHLLATRTKDQADTEDIAELENLWRKANGQKLRKIHKKEPFDWPGIRPTVNLDIQPFSANEIVSRSTYLSDADRDLYYAIKARLDTVEELEEDIQELCLIIDKATGEARPTRYDGSITIVL